MLEKLVKPEVGMGATYCVGSDCYPVTVIAVIGAKTIKIQDDKAIRTDTNGISTDQEYTYECDPNGETHMVRLNNRGTWMVTGSTAYVHLGEREKYQDPDF